MALSVLLYNGKTGGSDERRFAIKADSFSVNYVKTPVQIPLPNGVSPQIMDFGFLRPSITITGLVDTDDPSETVTGPDKSLEGASQIEIRYLNQEEAEIYEESQSLSDDLGMGIVLMNELKNVTWNFYDQRNREWVDNWSVEDYPNQRPSMVYMEISFLDESEPIQSYYWIPTVEDPATIARATQSGNTRGTGNSSGRNQNGRGGVVRPDGSSSRGDQGRSESRGRPTGGRGPARPPTSSSGRTSSSVGLPGGAGQRK